MVKNLVKKRSGYKNYDSWENCLVDFDNLLFFKISSYKKELLLCLFKVEPKFYKTYKNQDANCYICL